MVIPEWCQKVPPRFFYAQTRIWKFTADAVCGSRGE